MAATYLRERVCMSAAPVDMKDIQGIVRFGYGALTEALYYLLTIRDARAARAWLKSAPVTTAEMLSKPPITALQVAFTREGLEALGADKELLAGFSARVSIRHVRVMRAAREGLGTWVQLSRVVALGWAGKDSPSAV